MQSINRKIGHRTIAGLPQPAVQGPYFDNALDANASSAAAAANAADVDVSAFAAAAALHGPLCEGQSTVLHLIPQ